MKKSTVFTTLISALLIQAAYAIHDPLLQSIANKHQELVVSDNFASEYYFTLEHQESERYYSLELGEIVGEVIADTAGLESVSMSQLESKEQLAKAIFAWGGGHSLPYFCYNYKKYAQEYNDNYDISDSDEVAAKNCLQWTYDMVAPAIKKGYLVQLLAVDGNYYGDLSQVSIIIIERTRQEALTINLDIVHEI